jgi:hypothetical protein
MPNELGDATVFLRIVKTTRRGDCYEVTLGRAFASVIKFALAMMTGAAVNWGGVHPSKLLEILSRVGAHPFR